MIRLVVELIKREETKKGALNFFGMKSKVLFRWISVKQNKLCKCGIVLCVSDFTTGHYTVYGKVI